MNGPLDSPLPVPKRPAHPTRSSHPASQPHDLPRVGQIYPLADRNGSSATPHEVLFADGTAIDSIDPVRSVVVTRPSDWPQRLAR